jgi:hypothetical protein
VVRWPCPQREPEPSPVNQMVRSFSSPAWRIPSPAQRLQMIQSEMVNRTGANRGINRKEVPGRTGCSTKPRTSVNQRGWHDPKTYVDPSIQGEGTGGNTDLPAGIIRETRDLHAVRGAARSRSGPFMGSKAALAVTGTACELDRKALAHEGRSIFSYD